ncbi:MAG: hypothetical protein ACRBCI_15095 [Cellvibrionaceae bacterium]
MNKITASLLLVLFISSCAVNQPLPEGYTGPLSTIRDSSTRVSGTKIRFFQVNKVDGRNIETSSAATGSASYGQGAHISLVVTSRDVPAKKSVLRLQGTTYVAMPILAFGGGMYSVSGDVEVMLEPNKTYIVKGSLSKAYSAVWLEDDQGNIVSEKVEKIKGAKNN